MQAKTLGVLALVAAGAAAIAVWVHDSRAGESSEIQAGSPLFPDLDVNQVARLRVQKGTTSVSLARQGDEWNLVERGGYPADFGKVKQLLLQLADLELLEQKTANPELYAKLDLQDPGSEGANSALVVLEDAQGAAMAGLVVGKSNYGAGEALYVRKQGDPTCWLVKGRLAVEEGADAWVVRDIVKLERNRVRAVEVLHPDGESLRISRVDEQQLDFAVENVPPERELSSPSVASGLGSAMGWVSLEDMAPRAEIDFAANPGVQARFLTFDGLVLSVQTTKKDELHWVAFDVSFEAPPALAEVPPPPAEGEVPAPAAARKTPEEVQREVESLHKSLAPWAFQLPDYKVEALEKRIGDMLKPLPVDPGAAATPAATSGAHEHTDGEVHEPGSMEAAASGEPAPADLDAPALDPIQPPK